ncbi:MAG: hypothetical protein R2810_03970 [Flavobacteriales bacterium]
MGYFNMLFGYEWELTKSPAGAHQWRAKDVKPEDTIEDAHDPNKKHRPAMTTADMSMRYDPIYEDQPKVSTRTPRSSRTPSPAPGSSSRTGTWAPRACTWGLRCRKRTSIWQDPYLAVDHNSIDDTDIAALKAKVLALRWASASS